MFVGAQAQRNVAVAGRAEGGAASSTPTSGARASAVRDASAATAVRVAVAAALQRRRRLGPPARPARPARPGRRGRPARRASVGPTTGPYKQLVWSDDFSGAGRHARPTRRTGAPTPTAAAAPARSRRTRRTRPTRRSTARATSRSPPAANTASGRRYTTAQLDSSRTRSRSATARSRRGSSCRPSSGLCAGFWMVGDSASGRLLPAMRRDRRDGGDLAAARHASTRRSTGRCPASANFQQWQQARDLRDAASRRASTPTG